jgi:hypothetical protein
MAPRCAPLHTAPPPRLSLGPSMGRGRLEQRPLSLCAPGAGRVCPQPLLQLPVPSALVSYPMTCVIAGQGGGQGSRDESCARQQGCRERWRWERYRPADSLTPACPLPAQGPSTMQGLQATSAHTELWLQLSSARPGGGSREIKKQCVRKTPQGGANVSVRAVLPGRQLGGFLRLLCAV